jgi:hypothetical protein
MKIYFENGVTSPNVQILPDADPTPSGYTENTSIANFFAYGIQYGLTNAQTVKEIINLISDWATFPAADKTALQELANWSPTALSLGDGILNGATASSNAGAGIYINFDAASDDEILYNVALDRNGVPYDGSNIDVELYWMKFGAAGGTVGWELDYAFVNLGDDAYTAVDGTVTNFVNVTALADQTLTSTVVGTISGPVGSKILQLTLRRNSTGAGADTYTGDAELYAFNLEK